VRVRWTPLIVVLLLSATACHKTDPSSTVQPLILVVPKGSTQEYWRTIRVGASEEAEAQGLSFQWPSAFAEGDLEAQWLILNQAKAVAKEQKQRLAVALAPLDRHAFVEPVQGLQDQGIPVVLFDSELDGDDFVSTISTDNEEAGRQAGGELAKQIGGHGNVTVLRVNQISESTKLREKGFLEAIAAHPAITVVNKDHFAGGLLERAYEEAESLLYETTTNGRWLDGVFCPNESTTGGMLRALEERGLAGRVKLVGFDRTSRMVTALLQGKIAALVLQDPYEMGRQSVKMLNEFLRVMPPLMPLRQSNRPEYQRRLRERFARSTPVPFRIVTRADLQTAISQASIDPREIVNRLPRGAEPGSSPVLDLLRLVYPKVRIAHGD
jgi:ribose transport system substrate-binding protein